ncbi:hypothetical protein C1645_737317 [Glomus cerebriforme]|uniref:Uncharacterized protein n=1 Tax=Glomus cerebriforme TaxID=658196 RepID=A0A397T4P0_9GLOM|nr:hypothetical protein C1645_737317 [Glomus cerebriforme]
MANTEIFKVTSTSPQKLLSPVTMPHVTLQGSIHASNKGKSVDRPLNGTNQSTSNDFNTLYTTPTNNDLQQTQENATIINEFDDANKIITISDIEDVELNDNTTTYLSFALLNDFQYNSLHDLKTSIRRHFLDNESYISIKGIQNYYGIKIIRIAFNDEAYRNSIHNIKLNGLQVKFYNYENTYIDQIIIPLLEERYNKTIKIVDIPTHIDNSLIIETISKNIGPVINAVEPKPYKPRIPNNQPNNSNTRKPHQSFFKQLKIEFENYNTIQKILNEDIWSIKIEDFCIQILPAEIKSIGYKERTAYQYKITGLPISCILNSIQLLLTKIKARTCTFTPIDKRRITKSAYVNVASADFIPKNRTINITGHNVYVLNPNIKHCTICGAPNHDYKLCSTVIPNTVNKNSSAYVNRLTVDQFNNKFRSLIQSSSKQNNNNNLYPRNRTKQQHGPKNKTLIERLLQENAELKQLLHQSIQKIDSLQNLKNDVVEIKKNVLDNKEKIGQVNTKADIILSRTEELNQNIISLDKTPQRNPTYKRRKEIKSTYTPNVTSTIASFNPQIDSFSNVGSLQTITSINEPNNFQSKKHTTGDIHLTVPKCYIMEQESEFMENMNYEESSNVSESLNDQPPTKNSAQPSSSTWFNLLKQWIQQTY